MLIPNLYARGYIHGHEVGGTNPSLLKAMGCGNVILAHGVNFNAEVLGGTGYLWDKTPESLQQRLAEVDGDVQARQETARVACRERIRKYYTWDKVGEDHDMYFRWVQGKVDTYSDSF